MDINQDHIWYRKLHWQVLGAMLLGAVTGLLFGEGAADTVGWVGDLFMRLLRMVIVPLVLASIVSGVASITGGRAIGRLFGKTLGYYLLTSFLAAATGLVVVNLFRPGVGASLGNVPTRTQMPELDTATSGASTSSSGSCPRTCSRRQPRATCCPSSSSASCWGPRSPT